MAVFTVFEPPPSGDALRDAERTQFVRDGFSWAALLVPFLYLIWHRMWLVLVLWIAVVAATQAAAAALGAPAPLIAGVALALLTGFEAATLRRWTLSRRRWRYAGVVAGTDRDDCERRFFADRLNGHPGAPAPAPQAAPSYRASPSQLPPFGEGAGAGGIVGLFPAPERPR